MKKLINIFSVVVAAMTLSACNNIMDENATPNVDGKSNKITFTLSAGTRSALDLTDGESVYWTGTEKLGLNYYYTPKGGSEVKFVKNSVYSANAANATTANFTGDAQWWDGEGAAEATHKVYIYYPYSAANDSTTSSNIVGELPAEQEYDATASQWDMSAYDFLYTSDNPATYGEPLSFDALKRLFAVLRLGITNNTGEDVVIKKVTVTSQGGKILAGKFTTNISKGRAENALTNRTDAPVKATHGSNTAYGYWTAPESSISTTVANGAVKAGEVIDVRVMMNAGYAPSDDKDAYFFDTTTAYLAGDTFTVNIVTDKGAHPEITFTAGALLRGQRAGKSITLDAAPTGEPAVLSIKSDNKKSEGEKFYLNSNITLSGSNLLNVVDVKIGGVAAEVVSQSNTELVIKMVDCTGAATEAASYAITYGADKALGNITVYPFYHYEDIVLGIGSNASDTYSDFSSANAYFVPDDGKVYSAKDFAATNEDYGIGLGKGVVNPYVTAKKTYAATMTSELYAAVKPYVVFVTDSSGKLTIVNPTNTDMALKNHRYKGEGSSSYNIYVGETFGTPFTQYRVMKSSSELVYANSVIEGTLTNLDYAGSAATSDAPVFTSADFEGNSLWADGRVILMQYKDTDKSTVIKNGFIHITKVDVTKAGMSTDGKGYQLITVNPETGKRDGKITFDMYWSKKLN
ncbi:MAG: hypothetical protein J6K78_02330 [Tidjanibacter sp.]|nr:hypothetical protein [Tidjanibacter sp.]